MKAAVLAGIGSAVPDQVVTNEMLAARMDTTDEWIRTRTGIRERRVVSTATSTGDLAVTAGRAALKSAGVDTVDAVVLATTTPDHRCPATAPWVATQLRLGTVPAFDVSAVCSGFVYALATAAGLIAAGGSQRVLVIAAEAFSTIIDPDDRSTAPIFGDGAGAVVLRAGTRDELGALLDIDLGSDGTLFDAIIVPGGGARAATSGQDSVAADQFFQMQGKRVFVNAVLRMEQSARTVLERTGWDLPSVDCFVGHQANVRILRAVAERLLLPPERAFVNLDRLGNTAGASIPLALADAATSGQLSPGDRVLLGAFGGGASWGSVTLRWPEIQPT